MATVELITKNAQGVLEKRSVGMPVGMIFWTAANTPPPHSLAAYGGAVSRTTYAKLFAAIGTTWGAGDGSTTFGLPDARGRVPWGSASDVVGTYYSAGLPNIIGNFSAAAGGGVISVIQSGSGSFSPQNAAKGFEAVQTNVNRYQELDFNASLSNAIYGGSNTVQPPALCLLPCIVYE